MFSLSLSLSLSMQNAVHDCLSQNPKKKNATSQRDRSGYREDINVKHRLEVAHVPCGISCVIPVHANKTCCVCRKQQTGDDGFPVLLVLQQSKISLHLAIILYLPPLLTLDEHIHPWSTVLCTLAFNTFLVFAITNKSLTVL